MDTIDDLLQKVDDESWINFYGQLVVIVSNGNTKAIYEGPEPSRIICVSAHIPFKKKDLDLVILEDPAKTSRAEISFRSPIKI